MGALSGASRISPNGGALSGPPTKAGKELPPLPERVVGGMAWRAMEKAKGVESRVGEGGNRTAESSQEGGANDRGLRGHGGYALSRMRRVSWCD